MKKHNNDSIINRLKINISAKTFAFIVLILAIIACVTVHLVCPQDSILSKILLMIIGTIISSAVVGFIIEIFSLDKIINDTAKTTTEQTKNLYVDSIEKISNKIAQNIDNNFLECLNVKGQDDFLKKYLACQYETISNEEYRKKLIESNYAVQKKTCEYHLNCELFDEYEETINISISNDDCHVQRNIKFNKTIISDIYTYQKVIWFSNKENRDSFDKRKVDVLIDGNPIDKDKINIEDIVNPQQDEYGIKICFVLTKGNKQVSLSYIRYKPITQTPTFCIFSFVSFKPKVRLILTENDNYKLDVAVMRNYEHFNNIEEFLLRGEVINHNNTLYDIEFPGWCLPGCGIVFWLQNKEEI